MHSAYRPNRNEYTRQEAINLAGITYAEASYFERIHLVIPHRVAQRVGTTKKGYVFYTSEQVEQLRQHTQPLHQPDGY